MSSTAQTAEGEKILIVDDDPGLSSLLERFFNSKGYRARAVPNTEQMDRLLGREVFNLVVLDLMLPGEDGLTACKRLRGANNQIPIIMLTAKGELAQPHQGPGPGRRRLPGQAVRIPRVAGQGSYPDAPQRELAGAGCVAGGRPGIGSGPPSSVSRGAAHRPDHQGIRPAAPADAPERCGAVAYANHLLRLGHELLIATPMWWKCR